MTRPLREPLGLYLTRVSRVVSRAFDDALARAGGSLPVWLVLISLKSGHQASQRELADAVGVKGATLTHHLDAMESAGLVRRQRDPANRRLHMVRLTPGGEALFLRLRDAARAFDERLRLGLSDPEITDLQALLTRLRDNVTPASGRLPSPWLPLCRARARAARRELGSLRNGHTRHPDRRQYGTPILRHRRPLVPGSAGRGGRQDR